jgi:predicted RNase H-like HicB family nuclease
MAHYVAIVEDAGPERAIGVWFPDLPGCLSAGDTVDEALRNAVDAIALYAETLEREGRQLPLPRTVSELREDADTAIDIQSHVVALVEARVPASAV